MGGQCSWTISTLFRCFKTLGRILVRTYSVRLSPTGSAKTILIVFGPYPIDFRASVWIMSISVFSGIPALEGGLEGG